MYRANRNAHAFASGLDSNPPWVVGWYFVPIALLWKPFGGMSESWRVSKDPANWQLLNLPVAMRWWWGLWLGGNFASQASFRVAMMSPDVETRVASIWLEMAASALSIGAALLLARMVRDITAWQTAHMETGQAHIFD